MKALIYFVMILGLGGCLAGPTSPLGPSAVPTVVPPPACPFVDLGAIAPSMTQGPVTIRSAADWNAYKAQPYVAYVNWGAAPAVVVPSELDNFDFSSQMVLIFMAQQGMNIKFSQACAIAGKMQVHVDYVDNDAIGPYIFAQAHAIAVPRSSLPQDWTICSTQLAGTTCALQSFP